MSSDGYIVVRNWERYQHYKSRRPAWIKLYLDLMHDDDYLNLTAAQRGVLHGIWMLTGESGEGRVSANRKLLCRQLNVTRVSLEPLIQAGFISISASRLEKKFGRRASTETETETERLKGPQEDEEQPDPERLRAELAEAARNGALNGAGSSSDSAIEQLVHACHADERSAIRFRQIIATRGLSEVHVHRVRQSVETRHPKSPVGYAVGALRKIEVEP